MGQVQVKLTNNLADYVEIKVYRPYDPSHLAPIEKKLIEPHKTEVINVSNIQGNEIRIRAKYHEVKYGPVNVTNGSEYKIKELFTIAEKRPSLAPQQSANRGQNFFNANLTANKELPMDTEINFFPLLLLSTLTTCEEETKKRQLLEDTKKIETGDIKINLNEEGEDATQPIQSKVSEKNTLCLPSSTITEEILQLESNKELQEQYCERIATYLECMVNHRRQEGDGASSNINASFRHSSGLPLIEKELVSFMETEASTKGWGIRPITYCNTQHSYAQQMKVDTDHPNSSKEEIMNLVSENRPVIAVVKLTLSQYKRLLGFYTKMEAAIENKGLADNSGSASPPPPSAAMRRASRTNPNSNSPITGVAGAAGSAAVGYDVYQQLVSTVLFYKYLGAVEDKDKEKGVGERDERETYRTIAFVVTAVKEYPHYIHKQYERKFLNNNSTNASTNNGTINPTSSGSDSQDSTKEGPGIDLNNSSSTGQPYPADSSANHPNEAATTVTPPPKTNPRASLRARPSLTAASSSSAGAALFESTHYDERDDRYYFKMKHFLHLPYINSHVSAMTASGQTAQTASSRDANLTNLEDIFHLYTKATAAGATNEASASATGWKGHGIYYLEKEYKIDLFSFPIVKFYEITNNKSDSNI